MWPSKAGGTGWSVKIRCKLALIDTLLLTSAHEPDSAPSPHFSLALDFIKNQCRWIEFSSYGLQATEAKPKFPLYMITFSCHALIYYGLPVNRVNQGDVVDLLTISDIGCEITTENQRLWGRLVDKSTTSP